LLRGTVLQMTLIKYVQQDAESQNKDRRKMFLFQSVWHVGAKCISFFNFLKWVMAYQNSLTDRELKVVSCCKGKTVPVGWDVFGYWCECCTTLNLWSTFLTLCMMIEESELSFHHSVLTFIFRSSGATFYNSLNVMAECSKQGASVSLDPAFFISFYRFLPCGLHVIQCSISLPALFNCHNLLWKYTNNHL
jgi:hypothetical protein